MNPEPIAFEVHHQRTGEVRRYKTLPGARRGVDRMDNEYGGYIARLVRVYAPEVTS